MKNYDIINHINGTHITLTSDNFDVAINALWFEDIYLDELVGVCIAGWEDWTGTYKGDEVAIIHDPNRKQFIINSAA